MDHSVHRRLLPIFGILVWCLLLDPTIATCCNLAAHGINGELDVFQPCQLNLADRHRVVDGTWANIPPFTVSWKSYQTWGVVKPENWHLPWEHVDSLINIGVLDSSYFKVVKNMPKPVPSGHPLAFQDEKRSTGKNELLFHDRLNLPPGHGKRWIVQTTQGVTSRSISRSLYSFGQTFEEY